MDPRDLTVYKSPFPKLRLGKDYDGGYIIAEIPDVKYSILVAGGISYDISFEEDFLKKYGDVNTCMAYDGTIGKLPVNNPRITFIRKNIGSEENDTVTNLYDVIEAHNDIFVKMDIEGGEIPWIKSLTEDHLNRFAQIVMEFHQPFTDKEADTFKKLNKTHVLVHFHGNNCCGTRNYKGVVIPNVFECTYIHKKHYLSVPELNTDIIPSDIDMTNIFGRAEIYIDYPPFVNGCSYTDTPYRNIPDELLNAYTMNDKIHLHQMFLDDTKRCTTGVVWDNNMINDYCTRFTVENIQNNQTGPTSYGNESCLLLLNAFLKYEITNKNVAVIGSETPWIEAMLINLNNKVTTIDYNVPEAKYDNLECKDYFNFFENNKNPYDAIITFSSIEHSGLGRYGDPLDPDGDLKAMNTIHRNLKDNGLVIWGAPVGKDTLVWNAHRIYGEVRLPYIFQKFNDIEWFGRTKEDLFNNLGYGDLYQPVVVLSKK